MSQAVSQEAVIPFACEEGNIQQKAVFGIVEAGIYHHEERGIIYA